MFWSEVDTDGHSILKHVSRDLGKGMTLREPDVLEELEAPGFPTGVHEALVAEANIILTIRL